MKTPFQRKLALMAGFTFFLSLLPKISSAQINPPYTIRNHLSCKVIVQWDIWTGSCSSCVTGGPVTLQAGGVPGDTYILTSTDFGSCSPACDLQVTIIDIGGTPMSVTASSANPNPSLPAVSGCTGPARHIDWFQDACFIVP